MDIRRGVVSLATGAGAVYLLYKAIKAGIKCQPPFCSASPICIARECPRPGERARPQEVPIPQVSGVGGAQGDSSTFLSCAFFTSIFPRPTLEMLGQGAQVVDGTQVHPQESSGRSLNSAFTLASRMDRNLVSAVLPKGKPGDLCAQSLH